MRKFLLIILCACALASCKEYQVDNNPALRLSFSKDTVSFDTLFTQQGSATLQLMVYNRNAAALMIDKIWLEQNNAFSVNIDGEADVTRLTNLQINGGDSMYVFIRLSQTKENQSNTPVLIEDILHFHLASGTAQQVLLQAYGQDVTRLGKKSGGRTEYNTAYTFKADKPYLIFDTLIFGGPLMIDAGATLYMHNGACIYALDEVHVNGTLDAPVVIRGDRLDKLFDSVPYAYAGGSWNGIYLQADKAHDYQFQYADILSGNIGLYCYSTKKNALATLHMNGCRIHNQALYGLVLLNTNALVSNTEISNCASYCVYCAGGKQDFVHTTVASYFNYTNIRIQSVAKDDAAAVFIDNLSKTEQTITSFYNSIITGFLPNQLVVATPFDRYYPGSFVGNYLKTDTLRIPSAAQNVYWQNTDTAAVFKNDFYKYKEYIYYDFHLDSVSPAIGIADSIAALPFPVDRDGLSRALKRPDAGCYQYQP